MKVPIILERYYKNMLSKTHSSFDEASDSFCPLEESENWTTHHCPDKARY